MATVAARFAPAKTWTSVVLDGVSWDEYEAQLRIIGDRHVRVNYDAGRMEIMSPLIRHGNALGLLGRMVDTLTEELDVAVVGADPVTLKRPDLLKGVEPDRLYFLGANAARVRGSEDLDLTGDPPPDLVIEVDATSGSVPRFPIFAALGIPEVWRLRGDQLQFLHLQADGTYQPRDRSRAFPVLMLAETSRFLEAGLKTEANPWIRSFRAFVREMLLPRLAREGNA